MKKIVTVLFLLTGVLLFSSCLQTEPRVSPVAEPVRTRPSMIFADKEMDDLEAASKYAIELTWMVKQGGFPIVPYINFDSSGIDIENSGDCPDFQVKNIVILDAAYNDQGVFSQRVLSESSDGLGRIDLRDEVISFQVRDANPEEASLIARDLLETFSKPRQAEMSAENRQEFKDGIRAYQKAGGLKPDGIFGKNTAGSMGETTSVTDILEIRSSLVYPSTPRHAVYILPLSAVEQNPDQFYNGFDSLESVKHYSMSPEGFAGLAVKGERFVVFVYFFDRVDPQRPISIRLSNYKQKTIGDAGQKWHAAPGKWPVVIETFTLEKIPKASLTNLYLNVFIRDDKADRCISSHQVQ